MWTEKLIASVYQSPSSGSGICDGNDELRGFMVTFFEPGRVKKNGWKVEQCLDSVNLRPVFAFLTPILKPDAQSKVTLAIATTIIASFTRKREIHWAGILRESILKSVEKLRGCTYTHIAPYLAHLYYAEGCLGETQQLELSDTFPGEYTARDQSREREWMNLSLVRRHMSHVLLILLPLRFPNLSCCKRF